MAHEITSTDRYTEVRKGGRKAWHGLGEEIQEGLTAQEALQKNGSNWTTSLKTVYVENTSVSEDGEVTTEFVEIPTHLLHVRDDNNFHLGMVSANYSRFENTEVADFADQLCGLDKAISVETMGTLYGGRRFFILVKLPGEIKAAANDPLAQYVLFSNGHGGTAAFQAYPTSIRVVCANTLRWSERDVLKGCRFKHMGRLDEKLEEVRKTLGIALKENEKFEEQVTALAGASLSESKLKDYFSTVYDAGEGRMFKDNDERKAKILDRWSANMDDERQLGGSSLWTAYNSVSQWYDHERGRFKSLSETNSRAHTNLFGLSDKMKRQAFKKALATV